MIIVILLAFVIYLIWNATKQIKINKNSKNQPVLVIRNQRYYQLRDEIRNEYQTVVSDLPPYLEDRDRENLTHLAI